MDLFLHRLRDRVVDDHPVGRLIEEPRGARPDFTLIGCEVRIVNIADLDLRDLVRVEVVHAKNVGLRRVREREPELVRAARRDREHVLRHADHERRKGLPGAGLEARDVGVVLMTDEKRLAVGGPRDPVGLLPHHQADDLFHREGIDHRGGVAHAVVDRDPLPIGGDSELVRELADRDLSDEGVRLAGSSVEHPDLVGAFGGNEDAELRIQRCGRWRGDRRRRGSRGRDRLDRDTVIDDRRISERRTARCDDDRPDDRERKGANHFYRHSTPRPQRHTA